METQSLIETRKCKTATPEDSYFFTRKKLAASGRTQTHNTLHAHSGVAVVILFRMLWIHIPHTYHRSVREELMASDFAGSVKLLQVYTEPYLSAHTEQLVSISCDQ